MIATVDSLLLDIAIMRVRMAAGVRMTDADFIESEHPRRDDGEWTNAEGVKGTARVKEAAKIDRAGRAAKLHLEGGTADHQKEAQKLTERISAQRAYVAIRPAALSKVLADGRFSTAHEIGASGGHFDSASRKTFENEYFGGSPIYGYVSDSPQSSKASMAYPIRGKEHLQDSVHQYGAARVELSDAAHDRTTFTVEDSYDMNHGKVVSDEGAVSMLASSLRQPSTASVPLMHSSQAYERMGSYKTRNAIDYIEAQVHGGVSTKHMKSVTFMGVPPSVDLQSALKKKGIPWSVKEYET